MLKLTMHTQGSFRLFMKLMCQVSDIPYDVDTSMLRGDFLGPVMFEHDIDQWFLCVGNGDEGARVVFKWKPKYRDSVVSSKIKVSQLLRGVRQSMLADIIPPGFYKVVLYGNNDQCEVCIRKLFARFVDDRCRMYAARKIQRAWRRSIANPEYKLCHNRLLREFGDMQ